MMKLFCLLLVVASNANAITFVDTFPEQDVVRELTTFIDPSSGQEQIRETSSVVSTLSEQGIVPEPTPTATPTPTEAPIAKVTEETDASTYSVAEIVRGWWNDLTTTSTCDGETCLACRPDLKMSPDPELEIGATQILTLTNSDGSEISDPFSIRWIVENPSVASVQEGKVTALAAGDTKVRAEYNGQVAKVSVSVLPPVGTGRPIYTYEE